ncbi:MAG: LPS assembly lipoprotein LptE [Pseudomonadota bacterium]
MSSFERRYFFLALAALAGCGFTPVYGPGSGAAELRNAVQVGTPDSSNAFLLVRELELRLGAPKEVLYTLAVDVDLDETGGIITTSQDVERFTLDGTASYTLATAEGTTVARGSAQGFTGYSASGTPIATRAARDDAQERLMVILADQIVTRLAAEVS